MAQENETIVGAALVDGQLVCHHCLTEEEMKDLDGLLSPEEIKEAKQNLCSRCNRELVA